MSPKDQSTQKLDSQVKRCGLQPEHRHTLFQGFRIFSFNLSSRVSPIQRETAYFQINRHRNSILHLIMLVFLCFLLFVSMILTIKKNMTFLFPGKAFVPPPKVDVGVVHFRPKLTPLSKQTFSLVERFNRHLFHLPNKYCRTPIR